jgi:hypothetical protein
MRFHTSQAHASPHHSTMSDVAAGRPEGGYTFRAEKRAKGAPKAGI